jgi:hypothetical protein
LENVNTNAATIAANANASAPAAAQVEEPFEVAQVEGALHLLRASRVVLRDHGGKFEAAMDIEELPPVLE